MAHTFIAIADKKNDDDKQLIKCGLKCEDF